MLFNKALVFALVAGVFAQNNTIVDVLASSNQNSALVQLLSSPTYSAILTALSGNGNFTVFAPNDAAIQNANLSATADYTNVLLYHVIGSTILSGNLAEGSNFANSLLTNETVNKFGTGQGLPLDVYKNGTNVEVRFGVSGVSKVVQADLNATNGVIHIVDTVIMPPLSPSETALAGNLTTLYEALNVSGLTSAVDSSKGITIFAPTNSAFITLNKTVNLDSINASTLAAILKYHVVQGIYYSTNITALKTAADVPSLLGPTVRASVVNGNVKINDATVVYPDIIVNNGVIHVIDQVLSPPANASNTNTTAGTATGTATGTSTTSTSTAKSGTAVTTKVSFATVVGAFAVVFCSLLL